MTQEKYRQRLANRRPEPSPDHSFRPGVNRNFVQPGDDDGALGINPAATEIRLDEPEQVPDVVPPPVPPPVAPPAAPSMHQLFKDAGVTNVDGVPTDEKAVKEEGDGYDLTAVAQPQPELIKPASAVPFEYPDLDGDGVPDAPAPKPEQEAAAPKPDAPATTQE